MEEKDLEILHKYMLRRIAEKNIVFSGMSYKFRETSKSMRTNIFRNFARGDMSYFSPTTGNINLDYINEDIYENGKSVSPYNYFDLDTLIAYDNYLERTIDEIYNSREKDGRRYFLLKDFVDVIDTKVPMFFTKNAGTKETGYYNLNRTIGTLKDKDNRPYVPWDVMDSFMTQAFMKYGLPEEDLPTKKLLRRTTQNMNAINCCKNI